MADVIAPVTPASVAVVGAGTMGVGIAYVHAVAGSQVWLVEPGQARREAVRGILAEAAASGLKRGKLTADQAGRVETAIAMVGDATDLPRGMDLIVETVPELPDLKERVLRQLAALEPRILATNTSSISIDRLSSCALDPSRFLGMHYFNPVWSLPMVELVRGAATSDEAVALARAFAESTGKTTIVSRDVPGFATSRLDMLAAIEAIRMLEDGVASAEDIDKGQVVAFRHPVGPLKLCDIVGLDVRLDIALYLSSKLGDRFAPPKLLRDKVARGELGVKSGKGFFDWSDTRYFVSKDAGPRA
ncbi:3-hydroxyacyl-CoA dehydrogenase family protein [uncultured Alsobacter sp.]|uniref:3-hydroxyacyl-CoA dehydrogenase family protein n=1 Tax=uncultured Alsobacter sp. TaxID=1748258 RepID=UPI0025ED31A4|nr:3-hydroxyacyl-CoA dehydrogenase NAD-binding domain-containing protein [uncultured Alsobacter sp.]